MDPIGRTRTLSYAQLVAEHELIKARREMEQCKANDVEARQRLDVALHRLQTHSPLDESLPDQMPRILGDPWV
jgi:hypothetical protein